MTDPRTVEGNDDDRPDYELDSDEANRQVDDLVRGIAAMVRGGEAERREAIETLSEGLRVIAAEEPDATDITVRQAIARELDPVLVAQGWNSLEPFEF